MFEFFSLAQVDHRIKPTRPLLDELTNWVVVADEEHALNREERRGEVRQQLIFWRCTVGSARPLDGRTWRTARLHETFALEYQIREMNLPGAGRGIRVDMRII